MSISAQDVAKLRELTGAGIMAAKKALGEAGGDVDSATELLRKAGAAKAAKRAGRSTGEGLVYSYVHGTGKLGVLLELQCETDFVARNDDFKDLAHRIAMHIAASDPQFLDVGSVNKDLQDKARSEFTEEARSSGKPDDVVEKIVDGRMEKWLGETVLMKQEFVMEEGKTIEDILTEAVAKIGENIRLTRFSRFNIEGGMTSCEALAQ
jgi:elongation factor Ts